MRHEDGVANPQPVAGRPSSAAPSPGRSPGRPNPTNTAAAAAAASWWGVPLTPLAVVMLLLVVAGGAVLLNQTGGVRQLAFGRQTKVVPASFTRAMAAGKQPAVTSNATAPACPSERTALAAGEPEAACPEPVGFPVCKAEAARLLDAMAAADAARGWRHGGQFTEQLSRKSRCTGRGSNSGRRSKGTPMAASLVAVLTANIWAKTELLLHSLVGNSDDFELLVVDELSDDGTPQRLAELGVKVLQPPKRLGVTHNWNWAYQEWLQNTSFEAFFISNNDVLVPDGVIDALAHALAPDGSDCDLVGPLSTVRGLGTWGMQEGLEVLYGLSPAAGAFVNNPLNYQRVQAALDDAGCAGPKAVHAVSNIQNKVPGISGFFFGMRRKIKQWAFQGEEMLFNPAHRIIGQEGDLFQRAVQQPSAAGRPAARMCLHTGAFLFHYKGSTIPPAADREKWHMPKAEAAQPLANAKGPRRKPKAPE